MQGRTLVESLLAVGGIWLMAREIPDYATFAILTLSGTLPVSAAGPGSVSTQALHFCLNVAVGACLILMRRPIARRVHPADSNGTVSGRGLLPAGLGVLAIYFIASGTIALGRLLGQNATGMDLRFQIWNGVVSMLVGVILLVCTRRVSRKFEVDPGG